MVYCASTYESVEYFVKILVRPCQRVCQSAILMTNNSSNLRKKKQSKKVNASQPARGKHDLAVCIIETHARGQLPAWSPWRRPRRKADRVACIQTTIQRNVSPLSSAKPAAVQAAGAVFCWMRPLQPPATVAYGNFHILVSAVRAHFRNCHPALVPLSTRAKSPFSRRIHFIVLASPVCRLPVTNAAPSRLHPRLQ